MLAFCKFAILLVPAYPENRGVTPEPSIFIPLEILLSWYHSIDKIVLHQMNQGTQLRDIINFM